MDTTNPAPIFPTVQDNTDAQSSEGNPKQLSPSSHVEANVSKSNNGSRLVYNAERAHLDLIEELLNASPMFTAILSKQLIDNWSSKSSNHSDCLKMALLFSLRILPSSWRASDGVEGIDLTINGHHIWGVLQKKVFPAYPGPTQLEQYESCREQKQPGEEWCIWRTLSIMSLHTQFKDKYLNRSYTALSRAKFIIAEVCALHGEPTSQYLPNVSDSVSSLLGSGVKRRRTYVNQSRRKRSRVSELDDSLSEGEEDDNSEDVKKKPLNIEIPSDIQKLNPIFTNNIFQSQTDSSTFHLTPPETPFAMDEISQQSHNTAPNSTQAPISTQQIPQAQPPLSQSQVPCYPVPPSHVPPTHTGLGLYSTVGEPTAYPLYPQPTPLQLDYGTALNHLSDRVDQITSRIDREFSTAKVYMEHRLNVLEAKYDKNVQDLKSELEAWKTSFMNLVRGNIEGRLREAEKGKEFLDGLNHMNRQMAAISSKPSPVRSVYRKTAHDYSSLVPRNFALPLFPSTSTTENSQNFETVSSNSNVSSSSANANTNQHSQIPYGHPLVFPSYRSQQSPFPTNVGQQPK